MSTPEAGGGSDFTTRLIARSLAAALVRGCWSITGVCWRRRLRRERRPDMREKFLASGLVPLAGTPEQLESLVRADMNKTGAIIKAAGIRIN